MAMKRCKECCNAVSSNAKTCPHCGVSQPGLTFQGRLVIALTFMLLSFIAIYFLFPDASASIRDAINFIHK